MGDNECLTLGGDKDDFLKLTEGKDETEWDAIDWGIKLESVLWIEGKKLEIGFGLLLRIRMTRAAWLSASNGFVRVTNW
jgi:hypothetical protein